MTDLAETLDLAGAPFTWKTLHAISKTEFVPNGLRGKPEAILACILTGRELGLGPMQSMQHIDVIDGKPSPSAEWMVGQVFEAGHAIAITEQTDKKCTVVGKRFRDGKVIAEMPFTFTIEMAARAGLSGKTNWKHYPEAMLYWRATAQLCRQFFPDLLHGLRYLPEELGSESSLVALEPPLTVAEDATIIDTVVVEATDAEWSELFALLGVPPSRGETMKALETRLRRVYALMHRGGLWPKDQLHDYLEEWAQAKHVGDLDKEKLLIFAQITWKGASELAQAPTEASA